MLLFSKPFVFLRKRGFLLRVSHRKQSRQPKDAARPRAHCAKAWNSEADDGVEGLAAIEDELASSVENAESQDYWSCNGELLTRFHVTPRLSLFTPETSNTPIPLKFIDVNRITHTDLDVKGEGRVDDVWGD